MDRSLRVLHVEDSERDVALLMRHLSRAGYELIFERVETPAAMKLALQTKDWDVILCDYSMPEFNALAAIKLVKEMELDIPIIIISGTVGEAIAVEAMRAGANDYVMKDNLARLSPSIERQLQEAENRRSRRRAEEAHAASEEELRSLFAAITDVILVLGADGRYLKIAQTNPTYLYKPSEELIGKTVHEVFPKEQADFFLEHIRRALDEGRAHRAEYRMEIDGVEVWFDGSVSPMSRDSVVFIARDITERKRVEKEMRKTEEQYRDLVENAHDIIYSHDLEGNYTSVNQAGEEITGYTREESIAMNLTQTIAPECLQRAREMVARKLAGEDITAYDLVMVAKDGRRIAVEVNTKLVFHDGVATGVQGIARDVTERKRAEEALRESETRYRLLFESNPAPMWVYDLETLGFLAVNAAAILHYGYSSEEFLSMTVKDIRPQETVPALLENLSKVGGGMSEASIWKHQLKDGTIIDVEITSHELVFAGRRAELVLANDVTERRKVDEANARRAAQTALRADVNAALAGSNVSLQKVLEQSTESIVKNLGAAFAGIWTVNKEGDVLERQASAGISRHSDGPHARVPVGTFNIGLIAKEGRPLITNDVQVDSRVSAKEWALREGMVAFAGYPLIVEDRLVGVMAMFARQRLADDTLEALASVSDIISQAIERKRVEEALNASEEQLRQSQKLEAIGQLAGGIAHDFNNLLTVINGYSDLLLRQIGQSDPMHLKVEEIKRAGQRAASLTHQLLAFSRKQMLQPKVLQLNSIVTEVDKMLRRLIGEDLDLLTVLEPSLGQITADPGQIEQVILNLSVNARDAMPQGGKLTIETTNVYLDNQYAGKHISIRPGHYVMLAVSDTGCGLTADTQARMFEPFFTTKEPGKGTGLGLSTVYGIVKQSGGNIWVYSELGMGTTFKVYLPRVDEVVGDDDDRDIPSEPSKDHETVLLTEDDEQVREISRMILEMNGYRVLEAASGAEALSIFNEHEGQIDLLMTDLVMPQMNGRELAQSLERLNPGIRVLYMSGYTDNSIVAHGLLEREMTFLQKPFTPDVLMRKVRQVLDAPSIASANLT